MTDFFAHVGLGIIVVLADIFLCLGGAMLLDKENFEETFFIIATIFNIFGFAIALSFLILGV